MKKFETVTEILFHLEEVKSKMDAFKAENPGIKFDTYQVKDIDPELLFELVKDEEREVVFNDKINKLTLYSPYTHGIQVFFISVPVARVVQQVNQFKVLEVA